MSRGTLGHFDALQQGDIIFIFSIKSIKSVDGLLVNFFPLISSF